MKRNHLTILNIKAMRRTLRRLIESRGPGFEISVGALRQLWIEQGGKGDIYAAKSILRLLGAEMTVKTVSVPMNLAPWKEAA